MHLFSFLNAAFMTLTRSGPRNASSLTVFDTVAIKTLTKSRAVASLSVKAQPL